MTAEPEYSLTIRHERDERNYPISIVSVRRRRQILSGMTFDGHIDDRDLQKLIKELKSIMAGRLPF